MCALLHAVSIYCHRLLRSGLCVFFSPQEASGRKEQASLQTRRIQGYHLLPPPFAAAGPHTHFYAFLYYPRTWAGDGFHGAPPPSAVPVFFFFFFFFFF
ncbi:MAG TPA: hypothetical protein H9866_03910, partial [Candidatus Tidjanibacter gallistercoris]|nr:hypothetical protein [Candidatus Tidjanibacter gallistercoris]